MHRPIPLCACLFFMFGVGAGVLCAQDNPNFHTFIHGNVRDANTHRVLARVVVNIDSASSGFVQEAETDSSGNFSFQGLSQDIFVLRVRLPGYEEASQTVDLTVPSNSYVTFELKPKPGSGSAATVEGIGLDAHLNARLASVPDKARKEFLKAREQWRQGKDLHECVDRLNKAVKLYPDFADAYVLLATLQMQQNDAAAAKKSLERALAANPNVPEAWFTRGMIQNREKDYAGAEKSLVQGLQLDDGSAQGHYELARTYFGTGRWQEAEPHAHKAAELQPELAAIHVLLGNIALRKQDPLGALKEFQLYLRLDPQGPMAGGVGEMVKKLQSATQTGK